MRAAAGVMILVATAVLSGCGSSPAGKELSDQQLGRLVLQPSDLPGFSQFSSGKEMRSELDAVLAGDPGKFGRQNGWTARYRQTDTSRAGPLTVASAVEVFSRDRGARDYLDALVQQQRETGSAQGLKKVTVSGLGDEAVGLTSRAAPRGSIRTASVTWRDGRFVGSILATGFAQRFAFADAVALARKQEPRLARQQ